MKLLAILIFATQGIIISGRLTVLSGEKSITQNNKRNLLCVSEDDGGGLVWNGNLQNQNIPQLFPEKSEADFQSVNESTSAYQKRKTNDDLRWHEYASTWYFKDWKPTNSKDTPMGPVLDRRWEDFREYSYTKNQTKYSMIDKFSSSGAIVISFRGDLDAHILLCTDERYLTNFCYWIFLSGQSSSWSNNISGIRKCISGAPELMAQKTYPSCAAVQASYKKKALLTSAEWRTFIIAWNETLKTISICDSQKLFITYKDTSRLWSDKNFRFTSFFGSAAPMLVRIHTYTFLHTTVPKATLTSPTLDLSTGNLCVELAVGLCAKCEMKVALIDSLDETKEGYVETINSSATAVHNLATWRYVRINKTIPADFRNAKLKLIPELVEKSENPLWAVASVRVCPPIGTTRYSKIEITKHNNVWPTVSCQKMLYDENIVVSAQSTTTSQDLGFDNWHCPEGKVGPYCSISCQDHLDSNKDCKRTVSCNEISCTCPAGFLGSDCSSYCFVDRYGYGCNETCGSCNLHNCNSATGHCKSGCDNSNGYHLPPFCKIGIDTLPPPDIDFINETSIRATIPTREEYKLLSSSYQFSLWKEEESTSYPIGDRGEISKNTSTIIRHIHNLEPGTSYRISCTLYINETVRTVPINGEWKNFTTLCISTKDFQIETRNTSLTLRTGDEVEKHACPNKRYDFVLQDYNTGTIISKGSLAKLPQEFTNLTPYNFYKITIDKGSTILFSRVVRTIDEAPLELKNIEKVLTSNTEVTLKWDPLPNPSRAIQIYKVVLQVQTYFGCENLKLQSPKGDELSAHTSVPNITFSDLIPYVRYVAKIVAYISKTELEKEIEFSTNSTDIPTATYSNLRFKNDTLMWDAPEDCTTISGPIAAKIVVTGVSKAVENVTVVEQTTKYFFNLSESLYGAETYNARVYAIRPDSTKYNKSRYETLTFTTAPKAPPSVRNLEIYEIDSETNDVYLRWHEMTPPTNGKIQHYIVSSCNATCEAVMEIQSTRHCQLWDKYICATVKQPNRTAELITVAAVNANVSTPGKLSTVPIVWEEVEPEAPKNFNAEALEKGVVNLKWYHPWRTGGRLQKFSIRVEMLSSRLRTQTELPENGTVYEYQVEEYQSQYNETLYLLSASIYNISIQAVTNGQRYSEEQVVSVQTPLAMAFEKELTMEPRDADSTILLHFPVVVNDTKDSVTSVLVKGPNSCENYVELSPDLRAKAGIDRDEIFWYAASFATDEFAGKTFTIGDNKMYGPAKNCPLKSKEIYVVMVIVLIKQELWQDSEIVIMKRTLIYVHEASWWLYVIWLVAILFLIIGIFGAIFYCCRRRRRRSLEHIVAEDEVPLEDVSQSFQRESISSSSRQSSITTPISSGKEYFEVCRNTPCDDNSTRANDVVRKEERMFPIKAKYFEDCAKHAIDSGLLDARYNLVDVFSETEAIRSQRANVKSKQYLLAYLTLAQYLLFSSTSRPCSDVLQNKINSLKKRVVSQRECLEKMTLRNKALRRPTSETSTSKRNLAKNIFPKLVSAKINRVYLEKYPPTDEDSDYIFAVYVDVVRSCNQYLATQLLKSNTFEDFWRMIAEHKEQLSIVLQPPDLNDTTRCPFIPREEFKPVPYINVQAKEFAEFESYATQKLILADNSQRPAAEQQITILCSTEWKAGRNRDPPTTVSLVT
ncbi:unnamed protein product [Xylocopa violacea]|uniref:Uncharacterized protein n=1 Tax=Xylocopa violacea TaxID=135666 RepID=A0ABP1PDN5_XYLVO